MISQTVWQSPGRPPGWDRRDGAAYATMTMRAPSARYISAAAGFSCGIRLNLKKYEKTIMTISRIIALLCGLLAGWSAGAAVIDIDNTELNKLISAGVPLIDIRTPPEWQQTGIVAGSHLLTFFDEQGRANPGAWLEKARAIAKPGSPVIVVCRSGNRTKAVSQFLSEQAGYAKVYNVRNGIAAWAKDGRALAPVSASMANIAHCGKSDNC